MAALAQDEKEVYDFHLVNIHERSGLAMICRGIPLLALVSWIGTVLWATAKSTVLMLWMSAVMNVAMWLWIVGNCFFCYIGVWHSNKLLMAMDDDREREQMDMVHVCVIPNYSEDEEMLAQTLQCLVECKLSDQFRVVLAMEEREGESAHSKSENLKKRFADKFADMSVAMHPADLVETHLDGTVDAEVPGKASNLKWAVKCAAKQCEEAGIKRSDVLVTVMDADCLFHPGYFQYVSEHFIDMREACKNMAREDHLWVGYQAPQVLFRNYYESPLVSRAWSYVSGVFELGGVTSLNVGGQPMLFSSYTLPLPLVMNAGLWSGDVIAEDHHIYLKCLFYSIRSQLVNGTEAHPLLQLKPVPLPVKSTAVISSEGYWKSCVERWHQAKRHAQGLSEFEYAFLAVFTMMGNTHGKSLTMCWRSFKALMHLFCIHFLPVFQSITFSIITLDWLYHRGNLPACPAEIWFANFDAPEFYLCGLAGAWALTWPILIPMFLVMLANGFVLWYWFILPGRKTSNRSLWDAEDAAVQPTCGSQFLTIFRLVLVDCVLFMMPVMALYGMLPMLLAYVSTFYRGNRTTYVTASKAASTNKESLESAAAVGNSYGATDTAKASIMEAPSLETGTKV